MNAKTAICGFDSEHIHVRGHELVDELIGQVLSRKLKAITSATITDSKMILKELESIRRKGYAVSIGS